MVGASELARLGHATKSVFTKNNAISPQTSKSNQNGFASFLKRFRKGIAVLVISLIVVVILALAFLIPPGAATIPLNVSYTVGETLIYKTTEAGFSGGFNYQTGQMQVNQSFFVSYVDTQTVQSFNGQTYNISHSLVFNLGMEQTNPISYNELLNKTGFSEIIAPGIASNEPSVNQTVINPVLAFLASPVVKVGDTAVIPITTSNAGVNMTGNVTVTFVGIQNITVPAGTFNVFRVDSSAINTTQTSQHGLFGKGTMTDTQSFTEQSYIEYDTGKLIQSTENSYSVLTFANPSTQSNSSMPILADNYTINTQLTNDLMPGQALPSPTPPPPQQQESTFFLQTLARLDMNFYTVQTQGALPDGFYSLNLTSSDSSVNVLLNFNNSRVVWYKLYPSQGAPIFSPPQESNGQAAFMFVFSYGTYTLSPSIMSLQNMVYNVTGGTSITVTQGTISLNVSVSGNTTNFVWTNTANTNQTLALTFQNGGLIYLSNSWT
jgi:hypothetical protein